MRRRERFSQVSERVRQRRRRGSSRRLQRFVDHLPTTFDARRRRSTRREVRRSVRPTSGSVRAAGCAYDARSPPAGSRVRFRLGDDVRVGGGRRRGSLGDVAAWGGVGVAVRGGVVRGRGVRGLERHRSADPGGGLDGAGLGGELGVDGGGGGDLGGGGGEGGAAGSGGERLSACGRRTRGTDGADGRTS